MPVALSVALWRITGVILCWVRVSTAYRRRRLIGEQGAWIGAVDQRLRAGQIVRLPRRKHQFDRIAQASTRAWILVVSPPRDRPIVARRFFSRAGAMLMRAHDGGVDHHVFVVVITRQQLEIRSKTPLFAHRLKRGGRSFQSRNAREMRQGMPALYL